MDDQYDPRRVFDESFSERQQRAILRTAMVGWSEASRLVNPRFDREAAHDLMERSCRSSWMTSAWAAVSPTSSRRWATTSSG